MNIGETIEAQNKAIIRLQSENATLTHQLIDCKKYLDRIVQDGIELKVENIKLRDMLAKAQGQQTPRSGHGIDTGIGQISYSCSGSIDLTELMTELEKVIKNNGVRDTIRILAMAV